VLSEAILDPGESSKSFGEREPLPVQAANPRKNAVTRCTKHWSSDEEQAGNRNEPEEEVFISIS
jgi:hypothetical protein